MIFSDIEKHDGTSTPLELVRTAPSSTQEESGSERDRSLGPHPGSHRRAGDSMAGANGQNQCSVTD